MKTLRVKKTAARWAVIGLILTLAGFVFAAAMVKPAQAKQMAVNTVQSAFGLAVPNSVSSVQSTQAQGACGGGNTIGEAIAGWRAHGVLDDVARLTGQTPGLDGSAASIVRSGIVKTIVVHGG